MLILNPARLLNLVKNATLPAYYAMPVYYSGESTCTLSTLVIAQYGTDAQENSQK